MVGPQRVVEAKEVIPRKRNKIDTEWGLRGNRDEGKVI